MEPEVFIAKWRYSELKEQQAAQSHFNDLCALLELPNPAQEDPKGSFYTFEKAVKKPDGGHGRADVWRRSCFAWEYKGDHKNLVKAYAQLKDYADALDNPPLLIVSDMKEIRVHTNFTNTVKEEVVIPIIDLTNPTIRQRLRLAWTNPDAWRPTKSREAVTKDAAAAFAAIAQKLRGRGHDPRVVAHFLNKIVFCLFAEDIGLLPDRVFADVVEESVKDVTSFEPLLCNLFRAMRDKDGFFGATRIPWFNGGLFDDEEVLPLRALDLPELAVACRLDWGAIDPFIFGTLFEKGLDPERRKEMASLFDPKAAASDPAPTLFAKHKDKAVGVHYTDPGTILKIVEPVVLRPWRQEWQETKTRIAALREKKAEAKGDGAKTKIENELRGLYQEFRERLGRFRVLDPACGSGNFLYLALTKLKDLDLEVLKDAAALGLPVDDLRVKPDCVLGIEVNPYAAELARVTVWIGEIQWQMRNGGGVKQRPILSKLDGIVCKDAVLGPDKREAKWPEADVVIGNPPFLGDKAMIGQLGEDYVKNLRAGYEGRVPGGADLVCYWFEKARAEIERGSLKRAGLVATNSIRGGANRRVLNRILETGTIFDAWSDEPWVLDGAAVRVSLVCFGRPVEGTTKSRLNGKVIEEIFGDLSAGAADLTKALSLLENDAVAYNGIQKTGPFEVDGQIARAWLSAPLNPNGRSNSDVLRPYWNGLDVTRRPRDSWIIDFGVKLDEADAALYEKPFSYIDKHVKPVRLTNKLEALRKNWWRFWRPREELHFACAKFDRVIVTPEVSKYRVFVYKSQVVGADKNLIVIARDDDVAFGILHSRFHELWALRLGTSLEDRPRYTPSTTFETFPFPEGLTPNNPAADYAADPRARTIAAAAKRLNELREAWLNPADLIRIEPEVVPGYPDRILPKNDKAAAELKKRTLTNLYNQRPAWLVTAHKNLDDAVAAAYGWPAGLADDEILAHLFSLNQARAAAQVKATPVKRSAERANPGRQSKTGKAVSKAVARKRETSNT